ncbi:MAG: CRTAC1 family protein, partial [Deltaproteobacteria bacterium]|nr:CRTAC1 family protein [Deltaproteobacteria bacterium]
DDGLLDLLITRFERPTKLLRNLGDSRFQDVTDAVGLDATGPALASSWADFDRDGDLDLFVGNYASVLSFEARHEGTATGSRLFVNDGGLFTDRSDLLPPEVAAAWVTAAAWVDVDRDGWLDLYVVSDLGTWSGNVLALNHLGALAADGSRFGLDEIMPGSGMAIGDLDGDEIPDFVLGERGNLRVMISQAGHWSEESNALGVALGPDQIDPWGVDVGDLDNDGDLDILASFGATHADDPDTAWDQSDAAFVRGSDGLFRDDAVALGLADTGVTRGVVLADLDSDGALDVAKRDLEGPNLLYLSQCDPAAGWLRVQLTSPVDNHFAVGARVRVEVDGVVQTRTIAAGGIGFGSGGPPEAHFGLGDAATVDVLQVIWPDGRVTTVTDVATSAIVRLDRIE